MKVELSKREIGMIVGALELRVGVIRQEASSQSGVGYPGAASYLFDVAMEYETLGKALEEEVAK